MSIYTTLYITYDGTNANQNRALYVNFIQIPQFDFPKHYITLNRNDKWPNQIVKLNPNAKFKQMWIYTHISHK